MSTERKHDLDQEELELLRLIENENTEVISTSTPERVKEHQQVAHNTINESTDRVQLRIQRSDLLKIKAKALRKGLPYQTYIKSVLHQDVN